MTEATISWTETEQPKPPRSLTCELWVIEIPTHRQFRATPEHLAKAGYFRGAADGAKVDELESRLKSWESVADMNRPHQSALNKYLADNDGYAGNNLYAEALRLLRERDAEIERLRRLLDDEQATTHEALMATAREKDRLRAERDKAVASRNDLHTRLCVADATVLDLEDEVAGLLADASHDSAAIRHAALTDALKAITDARDLDRGHGHPAEEGLDDASALVQKLLESED